MIVANYLKNKKVAVFGLARSGIAAVESLIAAEAIIYAYDDNRNSLNSLKKKSYKDLYLVHPSTWNWDALECLVLSPGVPLTHPEPNYVVKLANQHNCKIISDNEVLYLSYPDNIYYAITGTNGKSTTTSLIYHILKVADKDVQIGGNIGIGSLSLNAPSAEGIFVLELSSFQLDLAVESHVDVSIILNITKDHIDRHGDMSGYIKAKKRIFNHQGAKDLAVIGVDDNYSLDIYNELKSINKIGNIIPISSKKRVSGGVSVLDGILYDDIKGKNIEVPIGNLSSLKGVHNAQNIAAAFAAVSYHNIDSNTIIKALNSFVGLDHRMQYIKTLNGVDFYNDSKATNADATEKALTISQHIYWIIGGVPKEGGIESLSTYFPNISHAYIIGKAQEEFSKTLDNKVPYTLANTLNIAINEAYDAALNSGHKDAIVLLSPACASFDQFKSFEHRGAEFVKIVNNLMENK